MAQIIPAILSDNKTEFRKRLSKACQFSSRVQVDIIDGKFAPFLGVICQKYVKKYTKTNFLEAHIMIENPESQMEFYQNLGFKKIIPHYGALKNPKNYFSSAKRSIALNPNEPVNLIEPYLKNIETVLLMAVIPGKMGQKFIPQTINKIRQLRALSDKIEIEVDGGVNSETIAKIVEAGANIIVVGSAVFSAGDPKTNYQNLNNKLPIF